VTNSNIYIYLYFKVYITYKRIFKTQTALFDSGTYLLNILKATCFIALKSIHQFPVYAFIDKVIKHGICVKPHLLNYLELMPLAALSIHQSTLICLVPLNAVQFSRCIVSIIISYHKIISVFKASWRIPLPQAAVTFNSFLDKLFYFHSFLSS